jgi:hypothetical protein
MKHKPDPIKDRPMKLHVLNVNYVYAPDGSGIVRAGADPNPWHVHGEPRIHKFRTFTKALNWAIKKAEGRK